MLINIEGYPVSITKLTLDDLKILQDYYLPLILNGEVDDEKGEESRISKNASERWGDPTFFKKLNEIISPAPYIYNLL